MFVINFSVILTILIVTNGAKIPSTPKCEPINVIDLSHWNDKVDLAAMKVAGVKGVIHKATQGERFVDKKYAERRREAEQLGLLWGAYHFGTGANPANQSAHFIRTVGDINHVLLILDLEPNPSGTNMSPAQADEFVSSVFALTNRTPIVYSNPSFLQGYQTNVLTQCPLWIASYTHAQPRVPTGWDEYVMWQFTDGAVGSQPHHLPGIKQSVDLNRFCKGAGDKDLRDFWFSTYVLH